MRRYRKMSPPKKGFKHLLRTVVTDYEWIHLTLGMLGNGLFFIGSILFLPRFELYKTIGVWLFIGGSFLMLVGAIGKLLVSLWRDS